MSPSPAAPWLLCWQGLLATEQASRLRKLLPQIAGGMLCALLLVLPMATRTGLGLLILGHVRHGATRGSNWRSQCESRCCMDSYAFINGWRRQPLME